MAEDISDSEKEKFREKIRSRIQIEDSLLNARTSIFLITNGLLLASLGAASGSEPLKTFLTLLGLAISVPWAMCSWQSWKVIRRLTPSYSPPRRANK